MEQHCEVQQQLLQHVFVEKHFGEVGGDDEYQANFLENGISESGYVVHMVYAICLCIDTYGLSCSMEK